MVDRRRRKGATQLALRALAPFTPKAVQSVLAVFDKAFDVRPAKVFEERLGETVEEWRATLGRELKGYYHPQFLDAQSLMQLLMLVVDATVKERLSEKRRMYGRLLARADTADWSERFARVEEALTALSQVTEADLRVLKPIMAHVREVRTRGIMVEKAFFEAAQISVEKLQPELRDLSAMGIKTYTTRLERLGLLLTVPVMAADREHGVYVPTHLLEELIALTLEGPEPKRT